MIFTETKIGATERTAYALIRNGDIENVAQALLITADAKPEDITARIAEKIAADIENGECVGENATNTGRDQMEPVSEVGRAIAEIRKTNPKAAPNDILYMLGDQLTAEEQDEALRLLGGRTRGPV